MNNAKEETKIFFECLHCKKVASHLSWDKATKEAVGSNNITPYLEVRKGSEGEQVFFACPNCGDDFEVAVLKGIEYCEDLKREQQKTMEEDYKEGVHI